MRTLFIYPEFPKTFWSYEKILELVNRKVLLLSRHGDGGGLAAAGVGDETRTATSVVTDAEWDWAELVIISGMIVQKDDMAVQIGRAKQRGLPVAAGPFASSTPDASNSTKRISRSSTRRNHFPCSLRRSSAVKPAAASRRR